MEVTRKFGYFCNIQQFKITGLLTDEIIPGHTRFPRISYSFWNAYNIYPFRYNIKKS